MVFADPRATTGGLRRCKGEAVSSTRNFTRRQASRPPRNLSRFLPTTLAMQPASLARAQYTMFATTGGTHPNFSSSAQTVYGEMIVLIVWAKPTPGQGSFYRSQHELIGVFQVGGGGHQNNICLGRFGRNRGN